MKHILFLAALLLSFPNANAQLIDRIKKKAEDKVVQKAGEAMDGKKEKPAENKSAQQNNSGKEDDAGDVQVKRKFDFVPGNKVIYEEDFSGTEEGQMPAGWSTTAGAEVATLSKFQGHWLMMHPNSFVAIQKEPLSENCTIEFDLFTTNIAEEIVHPTNGYFSFKLGSDRANRLWLGFRTRSNAQTSVEFSVSGVEDFNHTVDYNYAQHKSKPLHISIAINKKRLRVWFDQVKILDKPDAVSAKTLQSGLFTFGTEWHSSPRESYQFLSNLRIADAGLTERDLSVGPAEPAPAAKTKESPAAPAKTKTVPPSLKDFGAYHALIIAVEDYADPNVNKLDNPVRDATQLQKTLTTHYTFHPQNIVFLKNPAKKDVIAALSKLRSAVKENDNLLIFYAGHGYWDTDMEKGYWLPVDAERDLPTNWIANEDITGYIRAIKSKHTLLISDACFSGGIFKTREAFANPRAVEEVYAMTSRKAITSGTLTVVPDKSVFIQYLIKKLEENKDKYLSEEQLFSQFKTAVINNSPGQVPQFGTILNTGDEGGNFIFIRK